MAQPVPHPSAVRNHLLAALPASVLAQLLLMRRRLETWYGWLLVNTLAVPLFASRELYLTAGLYGLFWCNAWYGLYRWRCALQV